LAVIEVNRKIKVDWEEVCRRNKGSICVEKDYQFPGGYYIRHKDTPYFLAAGRHDIQCMIENALAALGENVGPVIVATPEEAERISALTQPVMELLDTHLPGANGWYLNMLWKLLQQVRVHPRAVPLK